MNERVVAAQRAIEQILAGLHIETVICVDDVYGIEDVDSSVELVIGWFTEALSLGKTKDCSALLEESSFFDVPDDEIWKRRLRDRWQELGAEERITILDNLAEILGDEVKIKRDQESASLLKDLIPKEKLRELSPADWEREKETITEEAVEGKCLLCLFDHNLQGAYGYTDNGGILFLEKMIGSRGNHPVICGLLTHTIKEGDEIARSSQFADEHGLRREDLLVLSKDRLRGPMRFAHGLKMMSLNHARDFLTSRVREIAEEADKQANDELMQVDVYNFDYMVLRSSEKEGVWEAETLFRLFEVLRRAAFRNEAFTPENRTALDDRIAQIRAIREVETWVDGQEYPPNQRWGIRRLELYEDGDFINQAHLPLELGDIFEHGQSKYILIGQPCDLVVRNNGQRAAEMVTLVKVTMPPKESKEDVSFSLDYFISNSDEKAYVKFRSAYQISTDVLDLAVFNSDGQCRFDPSATLPSLLHTPWCNRFKAISNKFQHYRSRFDVLNQSLEGTNLSNATREYLEKALTGRISRSSLDISFDYEDGVFEFGLRRVGRYRQPGVAKLLSRYVAFLSRDAEEHDYVGPKLLAVGVWECSKSVNADYLGAKESTKFHRCVCQHARQISPENSICFESREAAIDYGREPCGMCRP